MSTKYSIGAINQLAGALEKASYTSTDITTLRSRPQTLRLLLDVLHGTAEIISKPQLIEQHIIDCDVSPMLPKSWRIEEHVKGGQLVWDPEKTELLPIHGTGNHIREELKGEDGILNANVLDYLLENPHIIPEEWKEKFIYFFRTIYRGRNGDLLVRLLVFKDGKWGWNDQWLDRGISGYCAAQILDSV